MKLATYEYKNIYVCRSTNQLAQDIPKIEGNWDRKYKSYTATETRSR